MQRPAISDNAPASSVGIAGVWTAFGRAIQSQFHPRMLFAMLLPFFIILGAATLLLFFAMGPLSRLLDQLISDSTIITEANEWLVSVGLFSLIALKAWLVPLSTFIILLPLSGIIGLAVAAVCVMPMVLTHLSRRNYPDVTMMGQNSFAVSVWNAIWVSMLFALGWFFTLPFWLVPPLGFVVSIFWWTFAFSRMMRIDAIVEHATAEERRVLIQRHNTGFWTIGLVCALINLLPPAWIFLPVFSGLVFTHYGLESLRRLRQEQTIDV